MNTGILAFDYDRQAWVDGKAAVSLRSKQIRDELAILRSAKGAEYLRFLGAELCLEQAVAQLEMELAGLEGQL